MQKTTLIPSLKYRRVFLILFLLSCGAHLAAQDVATVKMKLFQTGDSETSPIYGDPPTGDYEDLKAGKFSFQWEPAELQVLQDHRDEFRKGILKRLDERNWLYLAAWLKYEEAIPQIKKMLLQHERMYGWEGPDYSVRETYFEDSQYPYQMASIAAIEYISGKPFKEAVRLTRKERKALTEKATACKAPDFEGCWAEWLLSKFD